MKSDNNHTAGDHTRDGNGGESQMNSTASNRGDMSPREHGASAGGPMDTRNFAIGILSVTATILLTGLLVIGTRPAPVLADGMSVTGGDYVMLVGAYEQVDEEFVYLIDAPTERIIAYRFNAGRNQIEIVQGIDFQKIRQAADKKQPGRP